jgi:hypothetical protein
MIMAAQIKGGLVAKDMLDYARELARITGGSANVEINVWCHPFTADNIELSVFACEGSRRKKVMHGDVDFFDLRDAPAMIDEIRGELIEEDIIKRKDGEK